MAVEIQVNINTKDFERTFGDIAFREAPKRIAQGAGDAAVRLMHDTVSDDPTAPYLEGWLWGSGSVFTHCNAGKGERFRNKFREFSRAGLPRYATTVLDEDYREGEVGATVIFNAPYAALWHENLPPSGKFSFPRAGVKYMQIKIAEKWNEYIGIVGDRVSRG